MKKTIKIYAEVPEDWIEAQRAHDLGAWLKAGREMIVDKAIARIVEEIVKHTKIPKIKIDKRKLEEMVLREIARKKIEND